jgi:NAD(P)H-dependent FMN reductase
MMKSNGEEFHVNVFILAASLRNNSLNRNLAKLAHRIAVREGHDANYHLVKDFDIPLYDGDVEARGMPPGVKALIERVRDADAS